MLDFLHPQEPRGVQLRRDRFLLVIHIVHNQTITYQFGPLHEFSVLVHLSKIRPSDLYGNNRYRLFQKTRLAGIGRKYPTSLNKLLDDPENIFDRDTEAVVDLISRL